MKRDWLLAAAITCLVGILASWGCAGWFYAAGDETAGFAALVGVPLLLALAAGCCIAAADTRHMKLEQRFVTGT
jgi:hypothetical protein